jgi:hypothetical protein
MGCTIRISWRLCSRPPRPSRLVIQVWDTTPGVERRFLVKQSSYGPATTVFSPAAGADYQQILHVAVRTHGVGIVLNSYDGAHRVGAGCVKDATGLAVMLRKPEDYAQSLRSVMCP